MKYRRYGKFRARDYISAWLVIAFLLVSIIVGLLTDTAFYWLVIPFLGTLMMLWSVVEPNRECFSVSNRIITSFKGKKTEKLEIPSSPILVFSRADICASSIKNICFGNQSYWLRGRYAVSILQHVSAETALQCLHRNHAKAYTNTSIECTFEVNQFVYSFVCDQVMLNEWIYSEKCKLIIPESLIDKIRVHTSKIDVYVDKGY